MNKAIIFTVVAFCSLLGAVGQIYFKLGSDSLSWKKLAFGLFLYGFATVLYITMLRFGQLSVLYPIISLSYIFVMILSALWLNESLTFNKVAGAILIISGVALIYLKG